MPQAEFGTNLIFENERIKVWELTLAPVGQIGTHAHARDYEVLVELKAPR